MAIKIESFSEYEIIVRKRVKEHTQNPKLAEKLVKILLMAFYDGHNLARDGFVEVDVE